jgi:hypothetical protein
MARDTFDRFTVAVIRMVLAGQLYGNGNNHFI